MVGTRIVRQVQNCSKEFESDLYHNFCKLNQTKFEEHEHKDSTNTSILTKHFEPEDFNGIQYSINIPNDELNILDLKLTPGFKMTWHTEPVV